MAHGAEEMTTNFQKGPLSSLKKSQMAANQTNCFENYGDTGHENWVYILHPFLSQNLQINIVP